MSAPLVSVIIPAYNQGEFLAEAIRSVLDQTFPDFELIVVNDASPDHSAEVVRQFDDPRITLIEHEENKGLAAARNTGIRASNGDIIILLDSDDYFHPEKLEKHIAFLNSHPKIGVTYNARYELNYSATTIRKLYRPPLTVGLADLVLGFPFAPSDMVIRREWLFRVNLFDEGLVYFGEDQDVYCRLALEGCRFASVDEVLNYRRYHSGRKARHIAERMEHNRQILDTIFNDPRCPIEVQALRGEAIANHLLVQAFHAFLQNQTTLGQEYIREAVQLIPAMLQDNENGLARFLLTYSAADDNLDHGEILAMVLDQLPGELSQIKDSYHWAVGYGYLLRGKSALLWERPEDGSRYFGEAAARGAVADEMLLRAIAHELGDIEVELGAAVADEKRRALLPYLEMAGGRAAARRLTSICLLNRAFRRYHAGRRKGTPRLFLKAIRSDARLLANRGVLSGLVRSSFGVPASTARE